MHHLPLPAKIFNQNPYSVLAAALAIVMAAVIALRKRKTVKYVRR